MKTAAGNTLALQVDAEGNVRYDAIALQGQRAGKLVQSQFKDLVPIAHRKDLDDNERSLDRPSEDEVQATTEKTRAALEKLVNGKIKAAPNVICLHEQDNGIGWKHTNWRTGRAVVTRNRELVVQFILTLANYGMLLSVTISSMVRLIHLIQSMSLRTNSTSLVASTLRPEPPAL